MRWRHKIFLFILILASSLAAVLLSNILIKPKVTLATEAILQPAPKQEIGNYDYFGQSLTPQQAAQLVTQKGLNPNDATSYQRIGAVKITQELLDRGEDIFFNRKIGDTFGLQRVFGFGLGITRIAPEILKAIVDLKGQPTSNLLITLQNDLKLGSHTFAKGSVFPTGLDIEKGTAVPLGLKLTGDISCAACHAVVSPTTGQRLKGVPNSDLAIPFLIALAPNTVAGFARLNFNPLDPKFQGNGKTIIDSTGQSVKLPDPQKFEAAFDDAVLDVPFGNFESSPDTINNTTQIPSIFTFKSGPFLPDGQFAVGPFGGLTAQTNSVYSSEINLLAAAQLSAETIGIDPEVYLGVVLQNAADPSLRLPAGAPVKPSEWLRKVAPNVKQAELEDQIPAPGTGANPKLKPTLFTYNGLILSPNTNGLDRAKGPFLFAMNAISAWENTLVPPPNKSAENKQALANNSVKNGAKVFKDAGCITCHVPPFFTDNKIHPISEIGSNPARAESRLAVNDLLVAPQLYTFNTPVPIPANAEVINVPTEGISASPTTLPNGLLPNGGYKTTPLRGLYLSAPYLHDGGVAVRAGAIQVTGSGITVVDPNGLGLTGTLSQAIPADSASSLRALVDSKLRAQVIAANQAYPPLVKSNLDGTGHNFYVDDPVQQTDLVNFLLALDDNPGEF